jgi:hypothetical protein
VWKKFHICNQTIEGVMMPNSENLAETECRKDGFASIIIVGFLNWKS